MVNFLPLFCLFFTFNSPSQLVVLVLHIHTFSRISICSQAIIMTDEIDLPPETLDLILSHLSHVDLLRCTLVSRVWNSVAEARLYSNIILSRWGTDSYKLLPALKTRKHFLRRLEVRPDQQFRNCETDLLDIFLDYRPGEENTANYSATENPYRYPPPTMDCFRDDAGTRPALPRTVLGPNRPRALTHLSVVGEYQSGWMLNSIIFNLAASTLTFLKIEFYFGPNFAIYTVDLVRILETFPHLKDFSIGGHNHRYKPLVENENGQPSSLKIAPTMTAAIAGARKQYRLESLTFEPKTFMGPGGPDARLFFERLGHLKRIQVNAALPYRPNPQVGRPWELGRALQLYCPKLETIGINGPVAFWFFDLAILPHDRIRHIVSLALPSLPVNVLEPLGNFAPRLDKVYKELRLHEQEVDELLERKSAEPYFLHLTTLVLEKNHCLSAQDLISLGVQAPFLTRLEIQQWPVSDEYIEDMYNTDAAAAAAAKPMIHPLLSTDISGLVEGRRFRKRRVFSQFDLAIFLQHCTSLCHFSVTGLNIRFKNIIDRAFIPPITIPGLIDEDAAEERTPTIRPWACEERLETLKFGFEVLVSDSMEHELVWKHLGQFKKLRYLHLDQSGLFSSLSYGIEGLLEGGMSETLEEIRSLPGWWKSKDSRELVLWFARSFPKLQVLGLAYDKWHVDGKREKTYCAFLQNEEVKRCSIKRVFIEDAPVKKTLW